MKIRYVSFMLLASMFFLNSGAQTPQFDISGYKLPDMKRHSLETSFNLSGNNSGYKTPPLIGSPANKVNSNSFDVNFSTFYRSYVNSLKRQSDVNSGLTFNSNSEKYSTSYNSDRDYLKILPSLYFSFSNRLYSSQGKFVETDFISSIAFNKSHDANNSIYGNYKNDLKDFSMLIAFPLKLGKGRIEEVQDARQALYIVDELTRQGRISKKLSNQEMIDFAKLISELKNKRFFDARIRKIYEIEAIDSMLKVNNYILQPDARYFTTLNDFWLYGSQQIRRSGKRFAVACYPAYYFNDYASSSNVEETKYNVNAALLNTGMEFTYEKPISHSWQNTIEIYGSGGTILAKVKDAGHKTGIPNLQFGYRQTLSFFPDTRTEVTYSLGLNYVQLFGNTENTGGSFMGPKALGVKGMSDLGVSYYISPQLTVQAYSSLYYIYQDSDTQTDIGFNEKAENNLLIGLLTNDRNAEQYKQKNLSHIFQIRLTYSIF